MVTQQLKEKAVREARIGLLILVAVFSLPAIRPHLIGWLSGLVPLPIFYYLICIGREQGYVLIRNAILLSGGITLLFGSLPLLIFSLTLVPPGLVIFQAAEQRKDPVQAGLKGVLALTGAWLLFWTAYGVIEHINPYKELLLALDQGLTKALGFYLDQSELPAGAMKNLEMAVEELRVFIPRVLPALLLAGSLYTVWMNQVLGNWLLKKKEQALAPWRDFKDWQLPDILVWGLIIGIGALLFLDEPLNTAGLNLIVVLTALYFLQGLAVLASLLNRWALPLPLRILIYIFFTFQTLGVISMVLLGVADTWADFRKLNPLPEKPEQGDE
jgi:uncharacterized protein YybS (DUF2232 family)